MEETQGKKTNWLWLLVLLALIVGAAWWAQDASSKLESADNIVAEEDATATTDDDSRGDDDSTADAASYGEFSTDVKEMDKQADTVDPDRDFDPEDIGDNALGL